MPIPFTQYLLPHGSKRLRAVERSPEIETMASRFIEAGGWFECEMLRTGDVSFTACMLVDDEPQDVEIEICPNGPAVLDAVDKIVRATCRYVGAVEAAPQ